VIPLESWGKTLRENLQKEAIFFLDVFAIIESVGDFLPEGGAEVFSHAINEHSDGGLFDTERAGDFGVVDFARGHDEVSQEGILLALSGGGVVVLEALVGEVDEFENPAAFEDLVGGEVIDRLRGVLVFGVVEVGFEIGHGEVPGTGAAFLAELGSFCQFEMSFERSEEKGAHAPVFFFGSGEAVVIEEVGKERLGEVLRIFG